MRKKLFGDPLLFDIRRDILGGVVRVRDFGPKKSILYFDSMRDFMRANPTRRSKNSIPSGRGRYDWYGPGVSTAKECRWLHEHGWPHGNRVYDRLYKELSPNLPKVRRSRRKKSRGRQGDELDIHSVYRGSLDKAWQKTRRESAKKGGGIANIVPIIIGVGGNACNDSEEMMYNPMVGAILAEELMKARYSTTISVADEVKDMWVGHRNGHRTMTRVLLKTSTGRISRHNLVMLALAGHYRYYWFRAQGAPRDYYPGYIGQRVDIKIKDPQDQIEPILVDSIYRKEDAIEFIKEKLDEFVNPGTQGRKLKKW